MAARAPEDAPPARTIRRFPSPLLSKGGAQAARIATTAGIRKARTAPAQRDRVFMGDLRIFCGKYTATKSNKAEKALKYIGKKFRLRAGYILVNPSGLGVNKNDKKLLFSIIIPYRGLNIKTRFIGRHTAQGIEVESPE
jgi:hypothetical protein